MAGRVGVCLSVAAGSGKGDSMPSHLAGGSAPGKGGRERIRTGFLQTANLDMGQGKQGKSSADRQRGVALRLETETPQMNSTADS